MLIAISYNADSNFSNHNNDVTSALIASTL